MFYSVTKSKRNNCFNLQGKRDKFLVFIKNYILDWIGSSSFDFHIV